MSYKQQGNITRNKRIKKNWDSADPYAIASDIFESVEYGIHKVKKKMSSEKTKEEEKENG